MKKPFITLFSLLVVQLMFAGNVLAQQSSLTVPEFVESGQNFTISWVRWDDEDYGITDSNVSVDSEILRLQRFNAVLNRWDTIFQVESGNAGSYVDNVLEEGVYEYRMQRDIITAENEDEGDNYSDELVNEFPLTITIGSLIPDQVLCRASTSADCVTIDVPQSFVAMRDGLSLSAELSWDAVVEIERYELERFDSDYNQWAIVYVGDQLAYSFTGLKPGANQFRVRACQSQLCGEASLAEVINVEFTRVTKHQCEPIL